MRVCSIQDPRALRSRSRSLFLISLNVHVCLFSMYDIQCKCMYYSFDDMGVEFEVNW